MSQLNTVMAIFAVVAAAAIIGTVGVFLTTAQTADAWHAFFASKKECVEFLKEEAGNTTSVANRMCGFLPHK